MQPLNVLCVNTIQCFFREPRAGVRSDDSLRRAARTLAHRAFCAAAILLRPAAESVLFLRDVTRDPTPSR